MIDTLIKYMHNKRKFPELNKPTYIDLKCFSYKAKLTRDLHFDKSWQKMLQLQKKFIYFLI